MGILRLDKELARHGAQGRNTYTTEYTKNTQQFTYRQTSQSNLQLCRAINNSSSFHHTDQKTDRSSYLQLASRDRSSQSTRNHSDKRTLTVITAIEMPANYATRDMSDPNQMKKNKQSMADLKLRRLTELNNRLREDLERERIPVSQAAKRCVQSLSAVRRLSIGPQY